MIEASTIQVPPARMWFMDRIRWKVLNAVINTGCATAGGMRGGDSANMLAWDERGWIS